MTPKPAYCCSAPRRSSPRRTSISSTSDRGSPVAISFSSALKFSGRELTLACVCILAMVIFSLSSPYFATADNLTTVLRNSTELLLIGLGMTLLLAMGGVDVSVGVVMGLAALVIGQLLKDRKSVA